MGDAEIVEAIPWQLRAVVLITSTVTVCDGVGHGVLWLCVRLRAAAAGCEWSASSGSAFCRRESCTPDSLGATKSERA